MSERLFPIDDVPEVPLIREASRSRGENDARFRNDYPPEWDRCQRCYGRGWLVDGYAEGLKHPRDWYEPARTETCAECMGMGSLKARARLEAGHRCERCKHPYVPKGDAKMMGVDPSGGRWSTCDPQCIHGGPYLNGAQAEWRILTVHHLDGDKANCRWWNLAALCQRCHLEIQAKVVMERVYPHEHTEWFKPHAAGYYAFVYLGQELSRDQVTDRLAELLDLELNPTNGGST